MRNLFRAGLAASALIAGLLTGATTASAATGGASANGGASATGAATAPVAGPTAASAARAVPVGAGSTALERQRQQLRVATGNLAEQPLCWDNVVLWRNSVPIKFVSMEYDIRSGIRASMLRARATEIGPWEQFRVCRFQSNGATSLLSYTNNRVVAAETGSSYSGSVNGMLRARTDPNTLGTWEIFYTDSNPYSFSQTYLRAHNNLYVAAEEDRAEPDKGMLRARTPAGALGEWEKFNW